MQDIIQCHQCGTPIAVSEVLRTQLRQQLAAEQEQAIAAARQLALQEAQQQWQAELQRQQQQAQQQLIDLQAKLQAQQRATEQQLLRQQKEAEHERELLRQQLKESQQRIQQAQQAELVLRQEKAKLEERARSIELEVQRKLDAARTEMEARLRTQVAAEHDLKLKQKEKQIEDLRKALEDAKRRSELGSQELQGEVLELDIEHTLQRLFPVDRITPVAKGARGADIRQIVINNQLQECGTILWESKNAKQWQPAWLEKLKDDQRNAGTNLAVLVSATVPEHIRGFGRIDGVWVCDLKTWQALAAVLREQLIQISFAHAANQNLDAKMEMLYHYLSGDEFRQRVEAIIEAFQALQEQINKERRAMTKHWEEREKYLQKVMSSTSSMYGALQGIIGKALPPVAALEFSGE